MALIDNIKSALFATGICVVSIITMVVFLVPDGVGRVSSLRAVLRPVFTKHKEIQQSLPS